MGARTHDPQDVVRLKAAGNNNKQVAAMLGISESSVRRSLDNPNVPNPGELVIDAESLGDINRLLKERGLVPAEWVVVSATVNEWDGHEGPMRQLKVTVRRKLDANLLQPATVKPLPKCRVLSQKNISRGGRLFFVYGDDQRPNVDRGFERGKLAWVTKHQPDVIVDLGDGMDFPSVSGHKTNPAMSYSAQECIDDYATWLWQLRCAAPNAEIVILADNHVTGRLRDYQLANAAALYGVKPADVDGLAAELEPLISVRRMLRLDEMNIRYVAPPGDTHYAESHYEIVPGELVALHGYRTGSNLGKKFIDDYGTSVVYGHAHQQDVFTTDQRRRGVGTRKRLTAIGVGCGAVVQGGGGFAPGADWQQAALTVTAFPDGGWTWDYMNYEGGTMRWRDESYRDDILLGIAA